MEPHKIGLFLILACFFLSFLPSTATAAGDTAMVPLIALPDLLQEKPKTQWNAIDFENAGKQASSQGNYQEAIDNFNKAEALVVLDSETTGQGWEYNIQISNLERLKSETYYDWPGHEQESTAAFQKSDHYGKIAAAQLNEEQENKCLIVTATFGSPLASEVQLVRSFRDDSIRKSYTGSRFMPGFNAWYYSFSPQVSTYISEHPFIKPAMQVIISPLLWIVRVSQIGYSFFAYSPELATFAALCIGSTLYACLYVVPFALVVMWFARGRGWKGWNLQHMKPIGSVWAAIVVLLMLGVLISADLLTTVTSGLFVIATIILVAGSLSISLLQYADLPKTS